MYIFITFILLYILFTLQYHIDYTEGIL